MMSILQFYYVLFFMAEELIVSLTEIQSINSDSVDTQGRIQDFRNGGDVKTSTEGAWNF